MAFERLKSTAELSPFVVRDRILDRFSFDCPLENVDDGSGKHASTSSESQGAASTDRLLAIHRTGKKKPRYHWYAESMILCEGYDAGFFDDPDQNDTPLSPTQGSAAARLQIWRNAVRVQIFQVERHWQKPLRYALALVMASDGGISVDKSIKPSSMVDLCKKTLLSSILADGMVAEELDDEYKKPRERFRLDPRVVFGVPYFLLRTAYKMSLRRPQSFLLSFRNAQEPGLRKGDKQWQKSRKSVASRMKAGFWAGTNFNRANITPGPCQPEWLYDDPVFFNTAGVQDPAEYGKAFREKINEEVKPLDALEDAIDSFPYTVLKGSIQNWVTRNEMGSRRYWTELTAVVDVTKRDKGQSNIDQHFFEPENLLRQLWKRRAKDQIKKRLM